MCLLQPYKYKYKCCRLFQWNTFDFFFFNEPSAKSSGATNYKFHNWLLFLIPFELSSLTVLFFLFFIQVPLIKVITGSKTQSSKCRILTLNLFCLISFFWTTLKLVQYSCNFEFFQMEKVIFISLILSFFE